MEGLDRKAFLRTIGGLGLAAAGAGRVDALETVAWPEFSPEEPEAFWRAIRAEYPIADDPLYLNTGGLGPTLRPVMDTVFATMRKLQEHSETGHDRIAPARETVARFLGAKPEEICFTRNGTEANSIIASGLALGQGDEVIFETHAHPGGSFPWLNQARQRGVVARLFEPDHTSAEGNVARIRDLITPRTKVIQVSHVTCTTGLVMPVREIARLARSHRIWCHIDGAQSPGMIPINVAAIGCESFAFSGHKWLGGPHETGALFLRRDSLEAVAPSGIGAYSGDLPRLPGDLRYTAAASRHEYGTRNAALIEGLAEAVRFHERVGADRIAARGRELASILMTGLGDIDGLEILTPQAESMRAAMVTFKHPRAGASALFGYLLAKHRLRCRPVSEQGLEAIRVSTHIFNTPEDCKRVIAGVRSALRDL